MQIHVFFRELIQGQKEFRRRISRIQANKSHNTDDNKFTRIQKKVRALLRAREAIKTMKKLAAARKGLSPDMSTSNETLPSVNSAVLVGSLFRQNSKAVIEKLPELQEDEVELPSLPERSNSYGPKSASSRSVTNKPKRNTISR